ncbi:hypothetical protein RUMCAL_01135 [Ruminococcus callidus ATCC 27760]|uniref:Uncharacterized protein n=1 Tax=Ruminococcus callidus ATCC 27760 TaxID=411473 RepID=U2MB38_9FIRM|nr:hypothetical protein RUMCAL_01135 [Ruminococcus callidus ATCC 27760]
MSICDVPLYTQIADDAAQKIIAVLCGNIYTQIIAFSVANCQCTIVPRFP